jgi:hypothetical protein
MLGHAGSQAAAERLHAPRELPSLSPTRPASWLRHLPPHPPPMPPMLPMRRHAPSPPPPQVSLRPRPARGPVNPGAVQQAEGPQLMQRVMRLLPEEEQKKEEEEQEEVDPPPCWGWWHCRLPLIGTCMRNGEETRGFPVHSSRTRGKAKSPERGRAAGPVLQPRWRRCAARRYNRQAGGLSCDSWGQSRPPRCCGRSRF